MKHYYYKKPASKNLYIIFYRRIGFQLLSFFHVCYPKSCIEPSNEVPMNHSRCSCAISFSSYHRSEIQTNSRIPVKVHLAYTSKYQTLFFSWFSSNQYDNFHQQHDYHKELLLQHLSRSSCFPIHPIYSHTCYQSQSYSNHLVEYTAELFKG